jgi:hypothetical protein
MTPLEASRALRLRLAAELRVDLEAIELRVVTLSSFASGVAGFGGGIALTRANASA